MLRRAWKPLAVVSGGIIGPTAYYYYSNNKEQTFEITIRTKGEDGQPRMTTRLIPLLAKKQVDARLIEHATYVSVARPGGIIWKHTTASLASNHPIEDASAHQIIARDNTDPSAPGDLLFFAVMDGHGGPYTSRLLSRILIPAVVSELAALTKDPTKDLPLFHRLKSMVSSPAFIASDADPNHVSAIIQDAFTKLDYELVNAPVRVLASALEWPLKKNTPIPDLSQHPLALATMQPAVSGSCALLALLDTAHRNLYVACTGDARAVAGVWEETPDGQGRWVVEVLSEDQTGRNPNELKRMQSEHPPEESPYVIQRGRVLGGLEPSRAFGDARYKWPRDLQSILSQAFLAEKPLRPPPSNFKTPPYVTATPVVTHRKLDVPLLTSSTAESTDTKSSLRFLVLATDGLWDQLTSEQVVSLVGGHLAGLKGEVPKLKLLDLVRTSSGSPTVDGKDKKRDEALEGAWTFVDENVSTHLIRNALGGADEQRLRRLLSIPAPHSRSRRDDITVTVLWWEEGKEDAAKVGTTTIPPLAKAKL